MTILLELPQELERVVRRRAKESGREVSSWLVGFIEEAVTANGRESKSAVPRLLPSEYPIDELVKDLEYRPVVLPLAGLNKARVVRVGRLMPPVDLDNGR